MSLRPYLPIIADIPLSFYCDSFLHREETGVDGQGSSDAFGAEGRNGNHTKTNGVPRLRQAFNGIEQKRPSKDGR